jgi:hypothetical protein
MRAHRQLRRSFGTAWLCVFWFSVGEKLTTRTEPERRALCVLRANPLHCALAFVECVVRSTRRGSSASRRGLSRPISRDPIAPPASPSQIPPSGGTESVLFSTS